MNLYDEGYNDGVEYSEKNFEYRLAEMELEHSYQIGNIKQEHSDLMDYLTCQLQIKDEQIREYLEEIIELRKANEKLQRIIKINH